MNATLDLTTATPAEIDAVLAAASERAARAKDTIAKVNAQRVRMASASDYTRTYYWTPEHQAEATAQQDAANADLVAARVTINACNTEYVRRGGWTRYFEVTNAGGHVHSTRSCSTCFDTTQFAWLTEQSGMDTKALVELAGESACTVCFPWAPVDVLRRPSVLEAPERKAARLVREQEAAARKAKATEKGITNPDGTPLADPTSRGQVFKTERAATNARGQAIKDIAFYRSIGDPHPYEPQWRELVEAVDAAVAHKHGRTVEDVHAEAMTKARAAYKREFGDVMPTVEGL